MECFPHPWKASSSTTDGALQQLAISCGSFPMSGMEPTTGKQHALGERLAASCGPCESAPSMECFPHPGKASPSTTDGALQQLAISCGSFPMSAMEPKTGKGHTWVKGWLLGLAPVGQPPQWSVFSTLGRLFQSPPMVPCNSRQFHVAVFPCLEWSQQLARVKLG